MRFPRRSGVLKWAGVGLCALTFAAWLASRWLTATITRGAQGRSWVMILSGGRTMIANWNLRVPGIADGWRLEVKRTPGRFVGWDWLPEGAEAVGSPPGVFMVVIPLYLPFAPLALSTAWLFSREGRSARWAREGRCAKCGYSLSGLPPRAECPECGEGANA